MKRAIVIILCSVLLTSCGLFKREKKKETSSAPSKKEFTLPLPPVIESADNHAAFWAKYFWKNFDFSDTTQFYVIDKHIEHYIGVLRTITLTEDQVSSSLITFLDNAQDQPPLYFHIIDNLDHYLYDPNSQFRNENLYIIVLNHLLDSPLVSDVEKERYRKRLTMAMKNRVGDKATDFTYNLANGTKGNLYDIRAEYTLLFFSNPGCSACGEVIENLRSLDRVNDYISNGTVKVLMVYPDEDIDEWKAHTKDMPSNWINSYDKSLSVRDNELYDLRAIPTLYFLDKNKRVVIKDFYDVMEIEYYFIRKQNSLKAH